MNEKNVCSLKGCDGNLEYYDGALGYEAMVCQKCGAHHTHEGIFPIKENPLV